MPHALIENGVVTQLWLPDNPPQGYVEVPDFVQPGYTFDGENYRPPELASPADPLSLPLDRLTFWLVAAGAGVSKWAVRDHIEVMPEETADDKLQKYAAIAWFEEAKQYRRYDPVLVALAGAVGLTEDELDALWIYAIS